MIGYRSTVIIIHNISIMNRIKILQNIAFEKCMDCDDSDKVDAESKLLHPSKSTTGVINIIILALDYLSNPSQNPHNSIRMIIEEPTGNLECTLTSTSSANMISLFLYQERETPVYCNLFINPSPGIKMRASCPVTINIANESHCFYCIEYNVLMRDTTRQLSTQYDVTFISSTSKCLIPLSTGPPH